MKVVCLVLLLANLLFFGWSHWIAKPAAAPPATQPKSVPQLPLLNEVATSVVTEPLSATARVAGSPQTAPSPAECSSLGPFQEVATANQVAAALRDRGYEPHTRVVEGDLRAGLWVHLENLPRGDVQRVMSALRQQGISDAYQMPSQDGPVEISLGVFSELGRAQRRAEEARAAGLKPTITDRRKGASYWLDVMLNPGDKPLDPAMIQNGDDRTGSTGRVSIQECPRSVSVE